MGQTAVAIPEKIFFKIGEVCDIVDVQAHVLRYWETEFPMLSPQKNRSGQRTYRRRDVEMALRIKELLYDDLYTIAGAKKRLQSEMRDTNRLKIVKTEPIEQDDFITSIDEFDSMENETLEIGDLELDSSPKLHYIDDSEFKMDIEQKDALKSLTSQLLELRSMLKTFQNTSSRD